MKTCVIKKINGLCDNLSSVALLFARVLVAYGFYEPALNKWHDIGAIAQWFNGLGIPMPLISAYMATYVEILGVALLLFGLLSRYISFALIIVLIVAIITVHFPNGFSLANNGYEVPLYYISFLLIFISFGAGKISLDYIVKRKMDENTTS